MTGFFDTKNGLLISNEYYAKILPIVGTQNFGSMQIWQTFSEAPIRTLTTRISCNFLPSDKGLSYNDELIFDINNKGEKVLIFTRTRFALKIGKTTNNRIDAMNSIRSRTDASELSNTFAFSGQFTVFAHDASVKDKAVLILSAALFTVFAVTFFLLEVQSVTCCSSWTSIKCYRYAWYDVLFLHRLHSNHHIRQHLNLQLCQR